MEIKKMPWLNWMGTLALAFTVPVVFFKIVRILCPKNRTNFFKEKVVVITGASSGIGEALAHFFYRYGCKVVLCARRREELERVRLDLLQKYPTVPVHPPLVMPVDLNDINSFEEIVKKITEITGHIDILINNGGISSRGCVLDTDVNVFNKIMTVNYFGTLAFTKAVLPHMIKKKQGHIVFMSSLQGLIAIPNRSAYAASKHAVQAFADCLRAEVAKHNIHVTVVSPSYVNTNISINALTSSGKQYGEMDIATKQGYSTDYVAEKTVVAILERQNEIILAPFIHKMAAVIRNNVPNLYFSLMAHKAKENA